MTHINEANSKYAGKYAGRVRITREEESLSTLAADMAVLLQDATSNPDINVDIYRSGAKQYARVLFNMAIQTADSEVLHTNMTIENVRFFCDGIRTMLALSQSLVSVGHIPAITEAATAFAGNPNDWPTNPDSGSADAPQDDPDAGSDGGEAVPVHSPELETVDQENSTAEIAETAETDDEYSEEPLAIAA
ncbi:MAG: hypothetical protein NTZ20_05270 [Candidatus Levybacteria bacterium]|nr:hypothetical protein [Candidatus Levybacteria bacterium]